MTRSVLLRFDNIVVGHIPEHVAQEAAEKVIVSGSMDVTNVTRNPAGEIVALEFGLPPALDARKVAASLADALTRAAARGAANPYVAHSDLAHVSVDGHFDLIKVCQLMGGELMARKGDSVGSPLTMAVSDLLKAVGVTACDGAEDAAKHLGRLGDELAACRKFVEAVHALCQAIGFDECPPGSDVVKFTMDLAAKIKAGAYVEGRGRETVEKAFEDAERYRWLREHGCFIGGESDGLYLDLALDKAVDAGIERDWKEAEKIAKDLVDKAGGPITVGAGMEALDTEFAASTLRAYGKSIAGEVKETLDLARKVEELGDMLHGDGVAPPTGILENGPLVFTDQIPDWVVDRFIGGWKDANPLRGKPISPKSVLDELAAAPRQRAYLEGTRVLGPNGEELGKVVRIGGRDEITIAFHNDAAMKFVAQSGTTVSMGWEVGPADDHGLTTPPQDPAQPAADLGASASVQALTTAIQNLEATIIGLATKGGFSLEK